MTRHGSTAQWPYYFAKDILFLSHEPLLEKFREFKVFVKKLTRAIHKGEIHSADKLVENKPVYTLDHVIKESYDMMWKISVIWGEPERAPHKWCIESKSLHSDGTTYVRT